MGALPRHVQSCGIGHLAQRASRTERSHDRDRQRAHASTETSSTNSKNVAALSRRVCACAWPPGPPANRPGRGIEPDHADRTRLTGHQWGRGVHRCVVALPFWAAGGVVEPRSSIGDPCPLHHSGGGGKKGWTLEPNRRRSGAPWRPGARD
jgi:hypothetical protein